MAQEPKPTIRELADRIQHARNSSEALKLSELLKERAYERATEIRENRAMFSSNSTQERQET